MGYVESNGLSETIGGCASCGPRCGCKPCKDKFHGFGERYIKDEEDDDTDTSSDGKTAGFSRFDEPVSPASVHTHTFKIVVKSYIAPIGSATGSMWTIPRCRLTDPSNFKLRGLAWTTDKIMSENPLSDHLDKRYRLYSERTFSVTCRNGACISVVPSEFTTDVGPECPPVGPCLTPPELAITVTTSGAGSASTHRFSWTAEGRPPLVAEPAFQAVCPRTSRFIWHKVDGEIDCSGSKPIVRVKLVGSQFPSHRVFVNGNLVVTVPQGGFSNLWIADPADISRVR